MSGDTTIQALTRLTYLPDRAAKDNGNLIAGQLYYDVHFTGGDISGVRIGSLAAPLAITSGGTGQTTANGALNAFLPAQAGKSGSFLITDGTNASWSAGSTGITQLTGDATAGPGSGSQALTFATVNANVGSFGSTTSIPRITVNAKGLITAVTSNAVIAPAGTLTGATLAANVLSSSLTSVGTITTGVWNGTDIAFANIAQVGANTVLANPTAATGDISTVSLLASQLVGRGASGNVAPITLGTTLSMSGTTLSSNVPVLTFQYLTAGTAATYSTPAGCRAIFVQMVGGGGGGGATVTNAGAAGGTTTFNSVNANGGGGGSVSSGGGTVGAGGAGGTGSATLRRNGNGGYSNYVLPSAGGTTIFGGSTGGGTTTSTSAGTSAQANTGAGGGGASSNGVADYAAKGGGAGEYVELYITSPSASYLYTIGAGGTGGAAGSLAGGNGGSGFIKVTEYY